jgi:hypothetical protein
MCNQRETTLDHLYSTHRHENKALRRPPFGKSDHNYILLIPAYKLKWKQEAPMTLSKKSGQMKQMLSYRTEIRFGILPMALRTSVTGFINKCIDDIVPTVTVRTYPNQKLWITGNIRTELKGRAVAFMERDSNPYAYKKSRYVF